MKITTHTTDHALLQELGERLASERLGRDLTQAQLAEQAGISKRTLERLEAGAVASQLSSLLRVLRALGLLERLDLLLPESRPGPVLQLRGGGRVRQRASGRQAADTRSPVSWSWER